MAARVRFELTKPFGLPVFGTGAISLTLPSCHYLDSSAEKVEFEFTKRLRVYSLSKRAPSATRPLLRRTIDGGQSEISNSRDACASAGFQDRCHKPLGHLTVTFHIAKPPVGFPAGGLLRPAAANLITHPTGILPTTRMTNGWTNW